MGIMRQQAPGTLFLPGKVLSLSFPGLSGKVPLGAFDH